MTALPIRPLPSVKGWIDANWALAIAAWASTGRSSRLAKATRSLMESATVSGGGGTNSALRGE